MNETQNEKGRLEGPQGGLTRVRFTHLEKMMFPEIGAMKKDIIEYYIRIAQKILPFLAGRPLTLQRFPGGAGVKGFYEKDAPQGTPDFVSIFTLHSGTAGRDVHFVICNNLDTLLWLANLAALELHVTLSSSSSYDSPDFLLFDIDPEPPLTFDEVIDVAHIIRTHLSDEGLSPYVKTSGKKGLHIVVPLTGGHEFGKTREFAHSTGKSIAKDTGYVVSEFPHSRDPGTIFIDYLQNARGKTMAAPYSLRATPGGTVSVPLEWRELVHGLRPEDFNIRTMISRKEEPWREIFDDRQTVRGH
jgi:bifunctional non-homologous end joining protein LigD